MRENQSPFPARNGPTNPPPPPGNPVAQSNGAMMRGATVTNDRWSSGTIASPQAPIQASYPLEKYSSGKLIKSALADILVKIAAAQLETEAEHLVGTPLFKQGVSEENEPTPQKHPSVPAQQLRPRAEVIIGTLEGGSPSFFAIDKGDYILFPGGGVSDGEDPRDAAVRETLEESSRNVAKLSPFEVTEAIWPPDFPGAADGFEGERTHFFTAIDVGDAGISHKDLEKFEKIPASTLLRRLDELITDGDQQWARKNNEIRSDAITELQDKLNTRLRKMASDLIPGGLGATPSGKKELSNQFKVDPRAYVQHVIKGMKSEKEHTDDTQVAAEIARDHLIEDPAYYSKLERMEKQAAIGAVVPQVPGVPLQPDQQISNSLAEGVQQASQPQAAPASAPAAPAATANPSPANPIPGPKQAVTQMTKQADTISLAPRQEHVLFTPAGKILARRSANRRFEFPGEGGGRPAPYEDPVTFIPEGGVPEEGVHGYRVGMHVGDSPSTVEGYEEVDPDSALKDLYASMGLAVNKPYRGLDRARARVLLRALRKRKKANPPLPVDSPEPPPAAPTAPIDSDAETAVADDVAPSSPV
jgi:ADP-ribose pyrophosphatase YjhB (NUDIX family)